MKRNKGLLISCLLCCCLLFVCILLDSERIGVFRYIDANVPCKIIHISDIHGDLRSPEVIISEERPDLILITGDLIDAECNDLSIIFRLVSRLSETAPTYVALGNHEVEYENRTGSSIKGVISLAGAVVLDKEYIDLEVNGKTIRIGGIYGYCLPERYNNGNKDEIDFLRAFEATDSYKILLSHLPYSWSHYGITADYNIDLVLSGHTHGGQVILPFIGGLYDQEFGFFPGKISGVFQSNDTTVIVSRGFGSASEWLPRINNPAEIVVIAPLDE